MLNFKNTCILFGASIVVMVVADFYYQVPFIAYALAVIIFFSILFYGSYFIDSDFFIKAICKGETATNEVALTFDDGPVEGNTSKILDVLKQNNVKATFFCIGNRIEKNPKILKRIESEGHLLGNHSYSHHFLFDLFTRKRMKSEITATNSITQKLTGRTMKFFRPPYGVTTPVLAKAIRETNKSTIGWSIRSMDTVIKKEEQLLQKINDTISAGDIILLHDTAAVTVHALPSIINAIKQKGLQLVRLDQLLKMEAYE